VVSISSGDERLLYVGDTVLYPFHLEHPDWLPIYDLIPEQAEVSKRHIFDLAAEEQVSVDPNFRMMVARIASWCKLKSPIKPISGDVDDFINNAHIDR